MTWVEMGVTAALIAMATAITRFLAFAVFPKEKKVPDFVRYLGNALPPAVFGMLLVYCLKNVDILHGSHGIPVFIAIAVVVALHLFFRKTLLSIAGGTICYMLLVQLVFAS